jgi:hypothetical protein
MFRSRRFGRRRACRLGIAGGVGAGGDEFDEAAVGTKVVGNSGGFV